MELPLTNDYMAQLASLDEDYDWAWPSVLLDKTIMFRTSLLGIHKRKITEGQL